MQSNNKYYVLCGLAIGGCLLEYVFHFNNYVILMLMVLAFGFIWFLYDQKDLLMKEKENFELQEEIKSTAKDAHLKNKQLFTVVSSIPFPIVLLDQFGNIVMYNNNIEEISVLEKPKGPMNYTNNSFAPSVKEFMNDAFTLERHEDKIIKINNIEYQAIAVPVTAKQKYSGCLILFQNISKTLEGEKMQKRFIADASHELKTPIAVLKGMVEILNREDFDDDATREEFLKQMEKEIGRLDILVKDLLQLSRLSMSNPILERKKVDMREIVLKSCKSLEKQANAKLIAIVSDFQNDGFVFCDPLRMEQVMLNIIGNALKYSDRGTITISLYDEKTNFVIEVKDEGCGIRREDVDQIFERFYRVDDDRSRQSGGSGLGLPIVKSILDAHGASICVDSTPGVGSTFIIKLKN